jgi:hypothetical protein
MSVIDDFIKLLKNTKWELLPRTKIEEIRSDVDSLKSFVPGSAFALRRFLRKELNGHGKDDLGQRLFDHYLYKSGDPFTLTFDDMKHMLGDAVKLGHIDLRREAFNTTIWNPAWSKA